MRTIVSLAATALLLCASFGVALAQNAPDSGAPAAPAAPAAQTPPANGPPAPTQSANPPSANPPATTTTDNAPKTKKKKTAGVTRRREIERSVESGTVPSRYRNSVPKEYQQYIPFSKN